ncbi:hypothetical protein QOZ80_5AG0393460 [Eleusine coracana subsp. coracana]|nr:hypothetical protein QOZ80_5AG0393460 [Eleusine coracana subsp. coracana]
MFQIDVSCGLLITCATGIFTRPTKKYMDHPLDISTSPRMAARAQQREMMEEFWRNRKEEIEAIEDFGERAIPMTRLKKILCAEKGKLMMTFDTPSFLTKACEIFVQELVFRAWMCAASHQRCTILDIDIAEAIATTQSYDFLKDILHNFQKEHNSIPCSKATKKPGRSTNQSSTSRHPPLNRVPQYHPEITQNPPIARIPLPLLPTNIHPMPFPFSFTLQATPPVMSTIVTPMPVVAPTIMPLVNYMSMGLGFLRNGFNPIIPTNSCVSNNIVASRVMTHPLQLHAGATTNIPSTSFSLSMTNASTYDIDGLITDNIVAAPSHHLAIEWDHILPKVTEITSNNVDGQQEQQIDLDDSQHEQQYQVEEAILNHAKDDVDGTLDAIVASNGATNENGDNYDFIWDELEISNDFNIDDQQEQQIDLDDSQQEQQYQVEEAIINHALDVVEGTLDATLASNGAPNADGDNYDFIWDELELPDDSLMPDFLKDIIEVNPTSLHDATTSNDLSVTSDMQDIVKLHLESYLFDDLSLAQAQGARSPKAPM